MFGTILSICLKVYIHLEERLSLPSDARYCFRPGETTQILMRVFLVLTMCGINYIHCTLQEAEI